jgi:hypothetical protein
MKKLYYLIIGVLISISFTGCEKAKVVSIATVDTFIRSIKNPADTSKTVYAAIHSAFSYNLITSVTAVTPGKQTLTLSNPSQSGNSFYYTPVDSAYSESLPTLGTYNYTVTFKDKEVIKYSNVLSSSVLQPPTIISIAKSADLDSVYITWKALANVGAYQLKVNKGNIPVFYQPPFMDKSNPLKQVLKMGFSIGSFLSTGSGVYTFNLDGILFETSDNTYIQAVGSSHIDITL